MIFGGISGSLGFLVILSGLWQCLMSHIGFCLFLVVVSGAWWFLVVCESFWGFSCFLLFLLVPGGSLLFFVVLCGSLWLLVVLWWFLLILSTPWAPHRRKLFVVFKQSFHAL